MRIRTTVGASLIVAVGLTVGALSLVLTLRSTMTHNVDAALALRAADISAIVEGGALPKSIASESEEDAFVQILDARGRVLVSSSNVDEEPRLTDRRAGHAVQASVAHLDGGPFRVLARTTETSPARTIVVGRSLDPVNRTTRAVSGWLLFGGPALLALVAGTTWIVVGRALGPVDDITAEVGEIGGSDLHRRVPTPGTNDEIGRLASTMNEMLDRLEAASDRQKRFVSDAAHELRTPLATVRHEIDVARAQTGADLRTVVDDVGEESRRMERLVDDLLLLARQDEVHATAERAVVGLALVDLEELALVEAHRTRAMPVEVDTSDVGEACVHGDEAQLGRVVRNLVDNAVIHSRGLVKISVAAEGTTSVLTVEDDGPGVDPEDRGRIFERFARIDAARSRDRGGAGLGLAIARELAENHGGTIEVGASAVLGGAQFRLCLPRA